MLCSPNRPPSQCLTRVPSPGAQDKGAESSGGLPASPFLVNRRKTVCKHGKIDLGASAPGTHTPQMGGGGELSPTEDGYPASAAPASPGRAVHRGHRRHTKSTLFRCLLQPWPSPGMHLDTPTLLLRGRGQTTERRLGTRVHPCPLTLFKKLALKCLKLGRARKAFLTGS